MSDTMQTLNAEADAIREDLTTVLTGPEREALVEELDEVLGRIRAFQNRRTTRAHNIAG